MSSSNQRPANRGFRSVLRCAISHYRQFPCLSAPEPLHWDVLQLSKNGQTQQIRSPRFPVRFASGRGEDFRAYEACGGKWNRPLGNQSQ